MNALNKFCTLSISFLFCLNLFADGSLPSVKVLVKTSFNTPKNDKIFLSGNFKDCDWRPDCLEMQKVSEKLFEAFVPVEKFFSLKVTRGSWANEAADNSGMPLKNFTLNRRNLKLDQTIVFNIRNWRDFGALKVTGKVERVKNFFSPQLDNYRELHIRLPEDYDHWGNGKKYPVIYMHDGQNCFDPKTSNFGTDWAVDEVLTELVKENKVRDAIVVGIFSVNRSQEYNDASLGQLYGEFLVETVMPFIEQNYRALKGPENTFLMGSSYGSAISISLAWRYPNVFGRIAAVAFNGAFFYDNLFRLTRELPLTSASIYLDHGNFGGDRGYSRQTNRFLKHLVKLGFPAEQFVYSVFPYSGHTEADWARRVHIPLKFLLE